MSIDEVRPLISAWKSEAHKSAYIGVVEKIVLFMKQNEGLSYY